MIAKLQALSTPEIVGNLGLFMMQASIPTALIGAVLLLTGVVFYKGGY